MTLLTDTTSTELVFLVAAFILSIAIGVERQISQKSAGLRTHVLVGIGSAGFTLVSAYGFTGVLEGDAIVDPSRIAAQVVSGIGFIGAGVIFMRKDVVRGLTTAASIWLTAAVGMACGAGMIVLAATMTVLHLVAMIVLGPLGRKLPSYDRRRTVTIRYRDSRGVLRQVLSVASDMGFRATVFDTRRVTTPDGFVVVVRTRFDGKPPLHDLVAHLADVPGVDQVSIGYDRDPNCTAEE